MFRHVMLTVDLTDDTSWRQALPQAVDLVRMAGATLHILTVVPNIGSPLVAGLFPHDFESKALLAASDALEALVLENVPRDIAVKRHVAFGEVHDKILKTVDETGCDLLIMASHKPSALRDFLIGSHADRVLRRSSVSLLVVRA
ncbi:MAG: universal stress protein [Rhodobacteraceae bacterium]|nr:universal stress protein [Paracoccaceae bacterium]